MEVRRTALTFGDRPVEYRVSTIDTERHDYVNLLSRPTWLLHQAAASVAEDALRDARAAPSTAALAVSCTHESA